MTLVRSSEAAERGRADAPAPEAIRLRAVDDFDRDVWCVLGLPIDIADTAAAVAVIETAVRDSIRLVVATPNVNWLVRSLRDDVARSEILESDLSLADGAPVVAIARLLGVPLKSRTAGSDVFEALRARPGVRGRRIRVFFLGGRDGAAQAASAALGQTRSGLEPAGFLNPGHGDVASMSTDAIIAAINEAKADLIVVALSAAKGQTWIDRNKKRLAAPVISPLGAVVDFTAGTMPRAPGWMQRLGAEWAWRIYAEPALWRRYASDGLGLSAIIATRVLPQAGLGRSRKAGAAAKAAISDEGGATVVHLSGQLTGELAAVRQSFREAAAAEGDVIVDLSSADGLDRSFLGLMLMLEKHARRRGARIYLRGASQAQQALFKANAMNYPTTVADNGSAAGKPAAAAS